MISTRQQPLWLGIMLAWLCCLAGLLHAAAPLPASPSPSYVRDEAKWLSPVAFNQLNAKLAQFERDTSSQYLVAIFPKIPQDEELFDYSQRLYQLWKPGQADKRNGAILLIFSEDRKMRIHTGYGMEGVLPDARCKQIIQDIIAPQLRNGNREAAINGGIDAMIAAAKGEYKGTGKTQLDRSPEIPGWFIVIIIVGFLVLGMFFPGLFTVAEVIFSVLGASRGSGSGGSWGGGGGSSGGGFSGGGGSSGGGGASGDW